MNSKKNLFIIFLFCSIGRVNAQIVFQRIFKSPDVTVAYFAEQTTDSGFIIVGGAFLVKTDMNGHLLWSKRYLGPNMKCVHQTSDGGFIMAGQIYQGSPNDYDGFIMKTDSIGNVLWSNSFGETNNELIYYVSEAADGGYILSGGSADSSYHYLLSLVKFDSAGNQVWSKCFKHNLENKVKQTKDGGYVVAGTTNNGCNIKNGCLVKTDSLGNLIWIKDYCDSYIEEFGFTDVQETTDGGFIISGSVRIPQTVSSSHLLLIKTDSSGSITWQKAYYGNFYGESALYAVQQTVDGGYVASGIAGDYGATFCDAILIKTDTLGDIVWSKVYGRTTGVHQAKSISQTTDGGYILAGHIIPPGSTSVDKYFYVIKTDSIGNSGCLQADAYPNIWVPTMQDVLSPSIDSVGENSFPLVLNPTTVGTEYDFCYFVSLPEYLSRNNIFSIYPNPIISSFVISFKQDLFNATIKILNVLGEEVYLENFSGAQKTIGCELNTGIYFVEVTNGNERWTQKIIKQ
jgi:hypothetical protein